MANEEKNHDDEVKDLLARLRSQMSRLDAAFGIGAQETESSDSEHTEVSQPTAVADEEAQAESEVNEEVSSPIFEEEDVVAEEKADPEPMCEEEADGKAVPVSSENEIKAQKEPLEQIDIFAALDEAAQEADLVSDADSDAACETPVEDEPCREDDDMPIFSKDDRPIVIRKENIALAEPLVDEVTEKEDVAVVTEGVLPTKTPQITGESQASIFVPNSPPAEEKPTVAAFPFSTERRFDPSKYDAMLAAYEKRKAEMQQAFEEEQEKKEPISDIPLSPVLMPSAPITVTESLDNQTVTSVMEEETPVTEEELPETTEELPVTEEVIPEITEDPSVTEEVIPETTEDSPVTEEELPEIEEEPSVTEEELPEITEEPSVTEEVIPEIEEEPSVTEEEIPEITEGLPVTEEELPETTEETPVTEEEIPETTEEPSVTEEEIPETTEEPSVTEEELPEITEELPETTEDILETVEETPPAEVVPVPPPMPRIRLAEADLSDTEHFTTNHAAAGRVHLAPAAYRARSDRAKERDLPHTDEEEDFMGGLPSGIRESLVGSPLGRPNRAQKNKESQNPTVVHSSKKRKKYHFFEELAAAREESESLDYVRHCLREDLHKTRIRLIAIAAFAFVLLLLENINRLTGVVPNGFVEVRTAGVIDALLLFGAVSFAWPRLHVGAKGLVHGRVLPESILLVECIMALVYAAVFGFMSLPVSYFSFVPALGLAVLYCFRVLYSETRLRIFEKTNAAGEKLLFSPTPQKEMHAEIHALGKSLEGEVPLVYRVRKTASVSGVSARSVAVCEEEGLNLFALLAMLVVALACFLITLLADGYHVVHAFESALFGAFVSAPIFFSGVHVFPMFRADSAAGDDSTVIGESTVKEAVSVEAIAFEDVEAAPSSGVILSGIQVHCDDPTTVFKYLTALYSHIGGPLCGRFSGMYVDRNGKNAALVELVDATKDGVSAAIDGAEIVVGNGSYMVSSGITPSYDATEERVLPEGKSGILYVAVNGMVCMKFYMEHRISAAFEKNVLRLHRLGIATILRTYDPNFNEKTLARASSLHDCRVHVVSKTVKQRNDFYAEKANGGIVTSGSSAMLLRLFLLCFRTHNILRFGKFFKALVCVLGCATSVALTILGAYAFIPSVYPALYHLVWLAIYMILAGCHIKLPHVSEGK